MRQDYTTWLLILCYICCLNNTTEATKITKMPPSQIDNSSACVCKRRLCANGDRCKGIRGLVRQYPVLLKSGYHISTHQTIEPLLLVPIYIIRSQASMLQFAVKHPRIICMWRDWLDVLTHLQTSNVSIVPMFDGYMDDIQMIATCCSITMLLMFFKIADTFSKYFIPVWHFRYSLYGYAYVFEIAWPA